SPPVRLGAFPGSPAMTEQWYCCRDGQRFGPFSAEQLRQMASARQLLPTDMIWRDGMSGWSPARSVAGVFADGRSSRPSRAPRRQRERRPGLVDVRPVLARNTTNCVNRAEAVRDQIYEYFVAACKRAGAEGLVVKSHPYVMPVSLHFECWVPHDDDPDLRDRSRATITIKPKEFHRFDHVLTVEMQDNRRPRRYLGVVNFTEEDADDVVRHLLRQTGGGRPSFRFTRLRTHPLQLWRPANKLVR